MEKYISGHNIPFIEQITAMHSEAWDVYEILFNRWLIEWHPDNNYNLKLDEKFVLDNREMLSMLCNLDFIVLINASTSSIATTASQWPEKAWSRPQKFYINEYQIERYYKRLPLKIQELCILAKLTE